MKGPGFTVSGVEAGVFDIKLDYEFNDIVEVSVGVHVASGVDNWPTFGVDTAGGLGGSDGKTVRVRVNDNGSASDLLTDDEVGFAIFCNDCDSLVIE
jgi:hypothetical protein